MNAYYNENDPFAAGWLKNLVAAGHIAAGEVDDRSIVDVEAADLRGFTQCHFFAGIGGWSHALRLADWHDSRHVWTGSPPCQPFSHAGARAEFADERHLWPHWFELIRERKPLAIFGEQVASRDALAWLDHVCTDLEGAHYTVGTVDSPACGFGAPHRRSRLFWVADYNGTGQQVERPARLHGDGQSRDDVAGCGAIDTVADAERWADEHQRFDMATAPGGNENETRERQRLRPDAGHGQFAGDGFRRVVFAAECDEDGNCPVCGIDFGDCDCPGPTQEDEFEYIERDGELFARRLGHTIDTRLEGHARHGDDVHRSGWLDTPSAGSIAASGALGGFWANAEWIDCRDGKARPIEPGTFPLAYGIPGRVGRLRAYGNAIVAPQAAAFIRAFMDCRP